MYEELDAPVLNTVARRLFEESATTFFSAHASGMKSLGYSSGSSKANELTRAIEEENKALAQQREALEARRHVWRLLRKNAFNE